MPDVKHPQQAQWAIMQGAWDSVDELPPIEFTEDEAEALLSYLARHRTADTARIAELEGEVARLREALQEIADLPGEINPSNYDHDDACELNRQFCYGGSIATTALGGQP